MSADSASLLEASAIIQGIAIQTNLLAMNAAIEVLESFLEIGAPTTETKSNSCKILAESGRILEEAERLSSLAGEIDGAMREMSRGAEEINGMIQGPRQSAPGIWGSSSAE